MSHALQKPTNMSKHQPRTLEILAQLRDAHDPDALLSELEKLTAYGDNSVWNPNDGKGQAIKEGARECFTFVSSGSCARAVIEDTLEMAQEWTE